ncbi:MAG: response regulator [Flavipsychrobacter sp.]|jgi:signal transduction histidine kinase/ActR/RegA family two-component response regulator|nr:response regulator [Flavipsychrobacter sp.]
MDKPLSLFNWSLRKAQETEPESFARARIRIVYAILLFSLLKAAIVIGFSAAGEQWRQVFRAAIAFATYIMLLKVLLYKPARIKILSHIMLIVGVMVVWTSIFMFTHKINLPTIQFVFMITLSSVYILGNRYGIIYSVISILPVVFFLFFGGDPEIYWTDTTQEFASPGYEIIIVLNFISMVVAHYLFFEAININVKEKEGLNQQLQLSIAEATKLAVSRSNFLSTMSHELRTPLNSVVGITELMLEDKLDERQKENLNILQYSAHDLLALINNILDFNKADTDKLVLEAVPFRLAEFMRNICSVLRVKANNKNLELTLDLDPKLEKVNIISDPTRLSQVMYNLIGNAVKFTEKGKVTVKLVLVGTSDDKVEILFSVLDTGIGIHADKHEAIFELFTQAESHLTRKHDGSGLGLAIVKKVLELFNSSIQLESSPGKGSKFFFTIPFIIAKAVEAKASEVDNEVDISHLRVLIAEDNDVNRMILMKQMGKLNIKPVMVENGEDAYSALLSGSFDVILMDLHMPIMGGYDTTRQIRSMTDPGKANTYIIAFTASITEQQKIFESGFDDFLYKPVNMNDLRDKLEKVALRERIAV